MNLEQIKQALNGLSTEEFRNFMVNTLNEVSEQRMDEDLPVRIRGTDIDLSASEASSYWISIGNASIRILPQPISNFAILEVYAKGHEDDDMVNAMIIDFIGIKNVIKEREEKPTLINYTSGMDTTGHAGF
jgi:hypothetical protein